MHKKIFFLVSRSLGSERRAVQDVFPYQVKNSTEYSSVTMIFSMVFYVLGNRTVEVNLVSYNQEVPS